MFEFEIALPAKHYPNRDLLLKEASSRLHLSREQITSVEVVRRSLDARKKEPLYRYRIKGSVAGEEPFRRYTPFEMRDISKAKPIIVVGAGPAGLFASLEIIKRGFKPIILERGKDVHARKYDMAAISTKGVLNPDSNYCFGEGGAGTFSDGKLYTRSTKRGNVDDVLGLFVDFGANPEILVEAHAHIGSDKLPSIIENMRKTILECGGDYHFEARVTDIRKSASNEWEVESLAGVFHAHSVILATGHSASDIYEMFIRKGWPLQEKGFALGVRAEHPQSLIDRARYHLSGARPEFLPPAEYSLVEQVDGRGVFSFCMCPGGILVPASTEPDALVLNGMSNSRRNSKWANAGIVTSVEPSDVEDYYRRRGEKIPIVNAMLEFRREIEKRAFDFTGSFKAPAQRMTDFVKSSQHKDVISNLPGSSYSAGIEGANLHNILPEFVAERLKKAFPLFDKKIKGYYTADALLLAVESRTSSPVRIPRDPDTYSLMGIDGIYPCGEGAGYSGGIVSSAIDGINAAAAACMKI